MSETKDTNPKEGVGIQKAPMHNLPCDVLMEMGLAMAEGARKYGSHNYRPMGAKASVYYDALMRHVMAWWEGEDIDPACGVNHLVKAICCLLVLRASQNAHTWIDDRPYRLPGGLTVDYYNHQMELLLQKHVDVPQPKHFRASEPTPFDRALDQEN
jgi:hypothetical protein